MKVQVSANGVRLELDISGNGDAEAAADLIRRLSSTPEPTPEPEVAVTPPRLLRPSPFAGSHRQSTKDPATLNARQRRIYDLIAGHEDGCHYTSIYPLMADDMTPTAVNSVCNRLCNSGYVTRLRPGVYQVFRAEAG